jgi:hypothetical protein
MPDRFAVLVCGGRDYSDAKLLGNVLTILHSEYPISLIVQGGASGADRLAWNWSVVRGIPCMTFKADWKKYGMGAGPKRNELMLKRTHPDVVIAFPGGKGTANMVKQAYEYRVEVVHIKSLDDIDKYIERKNGL